MSNKEVKALLIIEQCNPDMSSVPLVGYNYFQEISKLVDVTLVTHERNRPALAKSTNCSNIVYIPESSLTKKYYPIVNSLVSKGTINWPLYHTLTYNVYAEFNHKVYKNFKTKILRGDYDVVHVITPMMPRYPVKVVKVCQDTPFILGPVNGGVPFPKGFQEVARKEYAYLNFLRAFGRILIPGYRETYKKADKILVGSTYTLKMLKDLFKIQDNRIELFYENGIPKTFFTKAKPPKNDNKINLLFVGRLVPYKGADMLIESVSQLEPRLRDKIQLTIVGDGSEKNNLEKRIQELNLGNVVKLMGWVSQPKTLEYYRKSDIFCFPSIREFGGAVVLEAMACGLPCIVAKNGGIGEYVTQETGLKIEPISREYLIQELTNSIEILVENEDIRQKMSAKSIERAKEFEWEQKAKNIVEVYQRIIMEKGASKEGQ